MEDDASNDVEAVEFIESQKEDELDSDEKRPIMLLLRRLIRNKQNTVMTNAQIVDILESEFGISVTSSHELEVNIYIKIIKKYLKDWPQWEELERIATKLSNIKDYEAVSKVLNHKYKNLKEYLGVMLEAAKPLTAKALQTLSTENTKVEENIDSSDVVMEIQCTREQLNHLFFRRPRLDLNNTVFNMAIIPPSRISLKELTFEEILKSWVKIQVTLPALVFSFELMAILKHVLINKVHSDSSTKDISLNTNLQMKPFKKHKPYKKCIIVTQLNNILQDCMQINSELYNLVNTIFDIFKTYLDETNVKVPSMYRQFLNKYKYVRYLYAENDNSNDPRYDLQLEEIMSPAVQFYIGKFSLQPMPLPHISEWLKVECVICKMKFSGSLQLKEDLQTHFRDYHQNEPRWQCMHCKEWFTMDYLAKKCWTHEC